MERYVREVAVNCVEKTEDTDTQWLEGRGSIAMDEVTVLNSGDIILE